MTEDAVEAKSEVDRGVGFWEGGSKVRNIECEVDAWKVGKITCHRSRPLNLRLRYIKAARADVAEAKFKSLCDKTA